MQVGFKVLHSFQDQPLASPSLAADQKFAKHKGKEKLATVAIVDLISRSGRDESAKADLCPGAPDRRPFLRPRDHV